MTNTLTITSVVAHKTSDILAAENLFDSWLIYFTLDGVEYMQVVQAKQPFELTQSPLEDSMDSPKLLGSFIDRVRQLGIL